VIDHVFPDVASTWTSLTGRPLVPLHLLQELASHRVAKLATRSNRFTLATGKKMGAHPFATAPLEIGNLEKNYRPDPVEESGGSSDGGQK